MTQLDQVSIIAKANVHFDGKCVSHTVVLADGTKKSVGVILPAKLNFGTGAQEIMELVGGSCRVRLAGETHWKTYAVGTRFNVPCNSNFDIEVEGEPLHYICHFG